MTAPNPTDASPPTNRLTTAHLLLWTAATALTVAAIMPDRLPLPRVANLSAESRAQADYHLYIWQVATTVAGPILGAGLAGIGLATWRAIRRQAGFPTLPGHWLLMIVGSCALLALLIRLDLWIAFPLPVIMLVVAMSQVQEPPRWKRVFAVAGLSVLSWFLMGCCWSLSTPLAMIVIPALLLAFPIGVIVAAVRDVQLGASLDIFHWCGVIAFPALVLVLLVTVFVS